MGDISVKQWEGLDRLDVGRVKAGERVVCRSLTGFLAERHVSTVSNPTTGKELIIVWNAGGSFGAVDPSGDTSWIRMAPKPQERRTVYLNIYPNGSIIGHKNEDSADSGSNSRREGRAVPVHLVKGTDGNWQVEAETDKEG